MIEALSRGIFGGCREDRPGYVFRHSTPSTGPGRGTLAVPAHDGVKGTGGHGVEDLRDQAKEAEVRGAVAVWDPGEEMYGQASSGAKRRGRTAADCLVATVLIQQYQYVVKHHPGNAESCFFA